jgi:beta-galactosidase
MKKLVVCFTMMLFLLGCKQEQNLRQEISLNGIWKITKTNSATQIPTNFISEIEVPGLADQASPRIDSQDTTYNNTVYWYKRSFMLKDPISDVVQLKINKAAYHTRVYVNGKLAGENARNFTPTIINLKPFLNKYAKENELIIAVGCRNNLPDTVVNGHDFEKTKYTPGIYDDVKLILSGYPHISNVQTVPDILNGRLRVVAEIQSRPDDQKPKISYVIREAASGKIVSTGTAESNLQLADFSIKIPDCQLWSPENPFLYNLELTTSADQSTTRFGMRTFSGSKGSSVFLLNGKPYYLRGTNVCIFRFFEDPDRKGLPWDSKWVTKLHTRFKDMNWNSIRYCIGFPPERWYEVADSMGILIQDEFPVWTGGKGGFAQFQKGITSKQLASEYRDWMRERWNHPCVVIWDAQNESVNDTTGKAIQMVRQLDLSNRPWDNGYAEPMNETDAIESHPYLFVKYFSGQNPSKAGYLKDLLSMVRLPDNGPNEQSPNPKGERYPNPVINNEYSWLWLNRDGTPTTLTDRVYQVAFPEAVTKEQKYEACAKNTAILTEYWRAYRKCAGVLHFCGLGYSRPSKPRGQTSDNFIDLKNLVYEPQFYKYVKPSFSPVGLMVEVWDKTFAPKAELSVPVHVFNDTAEDWSGKLKLSVMEGNLTVSKQESSQNLKMFEKQVINLKLKMPEAKGIYQLQA